MRLKFVTCKVLQREAYHCAAKSPNIVDIHLMPQGLHNEPEKLREQVSQALRQTHDVENRPYDAILLGYGLCSNGIVGLSAAIPLVIPRGHDCITLLLGSKEKYSDYFDTHRGIYWYSPGWIETGAQPSRARCEKLLSEYTEKYGTDNAAYLMEMEQNWMKEYSRATYITWPEIADQPRFRQYTRDCAAYMKWDYDSLTGDPSLIQDLVDGNWNPDRFLVVEPGMQTASDPTSPNLIKAVPREE